MEVQSGDKTDCFQCGDSIAISNAAQPLQHSILNTGASPQAFYKFLSLPPSFAGSQFPTCVKCLLRLTVTFSTDRVRNLERAKISSDFRTYVNLKTEMNAGIFRALTILTEARNANVKAQGVHQPPTFLNQARDELREHLIRHILSRREIQILLRKCDPASFPGPAMEFLPEKPEPTAQEARNSTSQPGHNSATTGNQGQCYTGYSQRSSESSQHSDGSSRYQYIPGSSRAYAGMSMPYCGMAGAYLRMVRGNFGMTRSNFGMPRGNLLMARGNFGMARGNPGMVQGFPGSAWGTAGISNPNNGMARVNTADPASSRASLDYFSGMARVYPESLHGSAGSSWGESLRQKIPTDNSEPCSWGRRNPLNAKYCCCRRRSRSASSEALVPKEQPAFQAEYSDISDAEDEPCIDLVSPAPIESIVVESEQDDGDEYIEVVDLCSPISFDHEPEQTQGQTEADKLIQDAARFRNNLSSPEHAAIFGLLGLSGNSYEANHVVAEGLRSTTSVIPEQTQNIYQDIPRNNHLHASEHENGSIMNSGNEDESQDSYCDELALHIVENPEDSSVLPDKAADLEPSQLKSVPEKQGDASMHAGVVAAEPQLGKLNSCSENQRDTLMTRLFIEHVSSLRLFIEPMSSPAKITDVTNHYEHITSRPISSSQNSLTGDEAEKQNGRLNDSLEHQGNTVLDSGNRAEPHKDRLINEISENQATPAAADESPIVHSVGPEEKAPNALSFEKTSEFSNSNWITNHLRLNPDDPEDFALDMLPVYQPEPEPESEIVDETSLQDEVDFTDDSMDIGSESELDPEDMAEVYVANNQRRFEYIEIDLTGEPDDCEVAQVTANPAQPEIDASKTGLNSNSETEAIAPSVSTEVVVDVDTEMMDTYAEPSPEPNLTAEPPIIVQPDYWIIEQRTSSALSETADLIELPRRRRGRLSRREMICPIAGCNFRYTYVLNKNTGKETIHPVPTKRPRPKKNRFLCCFCGRFFKDNKALQTHEYRHTGEFPYICEVVECGKKFRDERQLKIHTSVHHRRHELPYSCNVCDRKYLKKYNFRLHVRKHTGERPIQCEYCGRTFKSPSNLRYHRFRCSEDLSLYQHSCPECNKKYTNKPNLVAHRMKLHGYKDPDPGVMKIHICHICGYISSNGRSGLVRHVTMVHSDVKPEKCTFCDQRFKAKSTLVAHVKCKHSQIRPHVCYICYRGFISRSKLERHFMSHTGFKRVSCRICPKLFYETSDVNRHYRLTHGVSPSQLQPGPSTAAVTVTGDQASREVVQGAGNQQDSQKSVKGRQLRPGVIYEQPENSEVPLVAVVPIVVAIPSPDSEENLSNGDGSPIPENPNLTTEQISEFEEFLNTFFADLESSV